MTTSAHPRRRSRPFLAVLACLLLAPAAARAQESRVPMPIPSPDGDTSFVGSVTVTFPTLPLLQPGKIFFTTNGNTPTQNSTEYRQAFEISRTTTLKAVRIRGSERSDVKISQFTRRKLPAPTFAYDGKPEFTGTKLVLIHVKAPSNLSPAPNVYYSLDGGTTEVPYNPKTGVVITKTCRLSAGVRHPDYDDSPVSTVDFKLLQQVEKPVVTPASDTFQVKNLTVKFESATRNAYFQYVLGADANPDTGRIGASTVLVGRNPGDVFIIRVVAKVDTMWPSQVVEKKFTYMPRPAAPAAQPATSFFHDTLSVTLSTTTSGSAIHYTLDGTLATPSKPRYQRAFRVDSAVTDSQVTVKSIAIHPVMGSSEVTSQTYTLRLSPPEPSVPGGEFKDVQKVTLKCVSPQARIFYTLDGSQPGPNHVDYNGQAIELDTTTELRLIAIRGNVRSPVVSYWFHKKTDIRTSSMPVVTPSGRDFLDTVRVTLSTPADTQAAIWYSLDGATRSLYAKKPIPIGKTAQLTAWSQSANLEMSAPRIENYILIPAPPIATPGNIEPFHDRVEVALVPRTPGSSLKYMLTDDGPFNDTLAISYSKPLTFSFAEKPLHRLRAAAVTGSGPTRRISQVIDLTYSLYEMNNSDTLDPGGKRDLMAGVVLSNSGAGPVIAKLGSFDQLNLTGFKDPSHTVALSAVSLSGAPKVEFTRPRSQAQAVYQVVAGRAVFVGKGPTVEIAKAGTYFAATDTLPPSITLASETPALGEATTVKLRIIDNVSGLACVLEGSGLPSGRSDAKPDGDGYLSFVLKNPAGPPRDLWFRAVASDSVNTARFPAADGRFTVAQAWSKLNAPDPWVMGETQAPYDLAGLPIDATASLTWSQIRKDNPDPGLTAWTYREGDYALIADTEVLKPGIAYWLGSAKARSSLALSKFQTSRPAPDGRFRITLRPGWNMISNPTLETLYWPTRHDDPRYAQMLVRGLWGWGWDGERRDYLPSDSLEPWKGYWVLSKAVDRDNNPVDSVIELLSAPAPLAKRAGGGEAAQVELLLDYGRAFPLRLGARTYAADKVGVEDEPTLPRWSRARHGWSARERDRLMTDVLRFSHDRVMRWMVVVEGAPASGRDSLVSVQESRLPPGFEAWAYSRRRNLKVRLLPGASYSLPGAEPDTLSILAGPAAKLAGLPELARAVETVDAFSSATFRDRQGLRLTLALPTDALVQAELWSLAGRRQAILHSGPLGSGLHSLPIPTTGFSREIAIIRLKASGPGWRESRVHKIAR